MPESVTDRPTKGHEYVFLLSKSGRYFYDADAIREEAQNNKPRLRASNFKKAGTTPGGRGLNDKRDTAGHLQGAPIIEPNPLGRNKRTVWTITTRPYSGAHFATMPPKLAELCIKAGSKMGDLVLDPYTGAGTTGLVAQHLRRSFVGCELNPEYAALAEKRIRMDSPLFSNVSMDEVTQ